MDWGRVNPKWADAGRSGTVEVRKEFYVVFTVLSSNVDGATVLILDSNLHDWYPVGGTRKISWVQDFWIMAEEI